MMQGTKRLGRIASMLSLLLAAGTTAAKADLVLISGEASTGIVTADHYGSTGTYYDAADQISKVSHPLGGPVAVLFVLNADNTFSTYTDAKAGPYDNPVNSGADDTQIGIVNNSTGTLNSFTISGPKGLFDFDGDGIDTEGGASEAANNPDTTGYGGPLAYFSNYTSTSTSGIVHFTGGIGAGKDTYFSLELDPASLTNGNITPSMAVPEPSTLISSGIGGLMVLSFLRRRRKAKHTN